MNHGQYGRMARAGSFQGPYRRKRRGSRAVVVVTFVLLLCAVAFILGRLT